MPQVTSDIEEGEAEAKQLKSDLKAHQTDRAAAKTAMAEATTIREKEAGVFAAEKADADKNIAAVAKATAAVEKGMEGSFLQTADAQVLQKLVTGQTSMDDYDREELTADEEAAIKVYEELIAAKEKEVNALTKSIE